jgi:hypothetical protein
MTKKPKATNENKPASRTAAGPLPNPKTEAPPKTGSSTSPSLPTPDRIEKVLR